jgi:ABC-type antimicrobial peptide transport system permease subunit
MIKLLFIVISILIIYSLLMVSVESKTFEIAVQRMVGLEKRGIIFLIICQSFFYVIPAILLAFALSIFVLDRVSDMFHQQYKIHIDRFPSMESAI